ncbi:DUF433 domain-containing protein [Dyadobacter frigoris]|uniref:DUF433 domain-containing protein n=1 Tax=Dyadobacter frigoris TaxID=2576211 RepID=A0A4U6D3W9_9BACT|nr:DUF433 domain-containing protein [Dyadobacter frigoris]TKT91346.1 DUF433 domain-containing protein [Dyadobacter frigoris]GLU56357.1 hypothetical protein Dfri01_58180 [Dyadobacter frigoris]
MNAELLNRITFNFYQCGGKPCIRNMRIRVKDILELLANGLTADQIIDGEFPSLEINDIKACLLYASLKL